MPEDQSQTAVRRWWVGIDVGGTFTDLVAVRRDTGEVRDHKVLTTRNQQELGVLQGIDELGISAAEIDEIVHGHTAGINAILSRDGAHTALITTVGHRDLLDIGRMDREFGPNFYDPTWLRPHQQRPIVARRNRFGIRERTGWDGQEILELDEDQLRAVAGEIRERGIGSVAICFVNSYLSQEHEQRAAKIIREELPDVYVQTSALYPVTKEHERTTTVVMDAYVGPTVTGYLHRLEAALGEAGFAGSLWIMTMNGGVGSIEQTSKAPVFQLVSGPVGGVSGAVSLARNSPTDSLITMDVGGTSTDVAAVRSAQTPLTDLWSVEHGLTMTMPVVDVLSVGSGAGSLIYLDSSGALRVGPESAGSNPGPACYGRGGTTPTVTDACLVLGILQPDLFAGGSLQLERDLAEKALGAVADQLNVSVLELADTAYQLACTDMAGSIQSITTYRGLDVREFALLAFGAAGPMMAAQVTRNLNMSTLVVPNKPGQFSATGLLSSDLRVTKAMSPMSILGSSTPEELERDYGELENAIVADLGQQGVSRNEITFERAFFAMYSGQSWDNRLPLRHAGVLDADGLAGMQRDVHELYQSRFGFSAEELPIILSSLEVTGVAQRAALPPQQVTAESGDATIRRTTLHLGGTDHTDVPVYARERLAAGNTVVGPALVAEAFATTLVPANSTAKVTESGDLRIALTEEETR